MSATGNPMSLVKCEFCHKYIRPDSLKRHWKAFHAPANHRKSVTHCDICWKTYSSKSVLKRHKMAFHDNNVSTAVKCDICGKTYSSKDVLTRHVKTLHSDNVAHVKCHLCCKTYSSNGVLNRHLKAIHGYNVTDPHHGENGENVASSARTANCKICGKTFREDSLKRHERLIHGDNNSVACKVCGKFVKDVSLKRHMTFLHPEYHKPNNGSSTNSTTSNTQSKISCEICGKCFSWKGSVKRHMAYIHGDQKPPTTVTTQPPQPTAIAIALPTTPLQPPFQISHPFNINIPPTLWNNQNDIKTESSSI